MTNSDISAAKDREAYSIAEAAKLWGIGRTSLYRAMSEGRLRTLKIGARRLVRRGDLEAFMEAHATPTP
ncbi:MAG TPA: helix-turn-helix domain-containing protein [Hyphomicrobiaceae bacterium]|nr:helix-turn-helix domain-containing protein [Hyphomicrobiaceae bacterium]